MVKKTDDFKNFWEFFPFYLSQHTLPSVKIIHGVGTTLALASWIYLLRQRDYKKAAFIPLLFGYGFAWFSHFFLEKNKPATFKWPVYSFMGDWVMLF